MRLFWELSKSASEMIFNGSELVLFVGTIVLVVGLIGEHRTAEKPTEQRALWYKRFELMVIIGVVVELVADGGIFFSSHRLQSISDEELARANGQIMYLALRYWWLGSKRDQLIAALKPFAGQKVAVLECALTSLTDTEIGSLAINIAGLLDEADWLNPWGEPIMLPSHASDKNATSRMYNRTEFRSFEKGRCTQGVFVEVPPTAPSKVRKAATKLSKQVLGVDLGRLNWEWPSSLPSTNDTIIVTVGMKGS
jgi:hypothetical protein